MYPLYLLIALILVSSFTSPFGLESCAGIFNWLPFVWLFWSLSIYFKGKDDMRRIATSLIFGTIPVLVIGYAQLIYGFNFSPRLFGSFIVWHMSDKVQGEFSGIFYNRNICAAWLSASLPFFVASAYCEVVSKKHLFRQIAAWLILMLVSLAMVMTDSRNSIVSLLLVSLSILLGFATKIYRIYCNKIIVFVATISIVLSLFSVVTFFATSSSFLDALIQFASDDARLEMWRFGVNIASNNFLYGFGPNGFSSYVSLLAPLLIRLIMFIHCL